MNDLFQTVCDKWTGDKLVECNRVKVQIFYETLNAQSRQFFVRELRPTFEHIREAIDLELIPYGKMTQEKDSTTKATNWKCTHGDYQCLGNKIQACAVNRFMKDVDGVENHQFDGKNQTLQFVHCMFKREGPVAITDTGNDCANDFLLFDAWSDIIDCAENGEADQILLDYEYKTESLQDALEHVPWVVINGRRSALAEKDLQKTICEQIKVNLR
jgi:hypothetical protein